MGAHKVNTEPERLQGNQIGILLVEGGTWKNEENIRRLIFLMRQVKLYIDGICHKTRGPGAWSAVLTSGESVKEMSGADPETTQHRADLTSLIEGLSALKRPCNVEVVCKSEYLMKGSCEWLHKWKQWGWKTSTQQAVRNADLWAEVDELFLKHQVAFSLVSEQEKGLFEKKATKLANKCIHDLLVNLKTQKEADYNRLNQRPDGSVAQPTKIYTDGSCLGNSVGGWGVVILQKGRRKRLSGGEPATTANRMEMMGAIQALKEIPAGSPVRISVDSQYVRRGMEDWLKQWKKNGWLTTLNEPVKNVDLWQQLDALCSERQVTWKWIKGHSGHPHNELADKLAKEASARLNRELRHVAPSNSF